MDPNGIGEYRALGHLDRRARTAAAVRSSAAATCGGRSTSSRSATVTLTETWSSRPGLRQAAHWSSARSEDAPRQRADRARCVSASGMKSSGSRARGSGAASGRAPRRRRSRRVRASALRLEVELDLVVARAPARALRPARAGRASACRARARRALGPTAPSWPGTSRRRPAAAARRRCRRASGKSAIPTLASTRSARSWTSNGSTSASRIRSATASAPRPVRGRVEHDAELVAAEPGERVDGRRTLASRGPIWRRSSSPLWWPSVSFSSLKWSRSTISTAMSRRGRAAGDRLLEPLLEEAAVGQPREVVGHGLAAGLVERAQIAEGERGAQEPARTSGARARRPARRDARSGRRPARHRGQRERRPARAASTARRCGQLRRSAAARPRARATRPRPCRRGSPRRSRSSSRGHLRR